MPRVSSKRQITIPIEQCNAANIQAGDEIATFVDREGIISIVKKQPNAAFGILSDVSVNKNVSELESLQSGIGK